MVKKMLFGLILVIILAATGVAIAAGPGDEIIGLWATDPEADGGLSHVDVVKNDGEYSATIVWLIEPIYPSDDKHGMGGQTKVDRYNPDPNKNELPIIGLEIMRGFTFDGDKSWVGGKVYDPDNGKTYKCKMKFTKEGNLKVRGYIGVPMIGRTTIWTRPDTPASTESAGE